jgi:tetratricopeptide (TPR) repeat protein
LEESQKHWPKGIDYRTHALDVLVALKPEDYSDQRSDLIYAYSLLAWDEIFNGQIDKGIADTKKAASLSMQTEGHPALNASYENGINALFQNKKYDEAQTLLDAFTQALLAGPAGTDRERELATVVDLDGVQIATIKKQWPQVAKYRADEAKRLAALDPKAYDGLKSDLVEAYGNLSFEDEEAGDFAGAIDAAKSGLKLDDTQSWILENEANGLLLSGDAKDAKTLYLKVKDINWKGVPISKAISDDLLVFCKLGYTPPETSGLARDLGVMTPELDSCLTAAAKAAHPR